MISSASVPPSPQTRRKPSASRVAGVKYLITAGAMAATLGGWVAFGSEEGKWSKANSTAVVPKQSPSEAIINLPPIPTLVPPPPSPSIPEGAQSTIQSPANVEEAQTQSSAPVLRMVSAPPPQQVIRKPAPAATTRSSR